MNILEIKADKDTIQIGEHLTLRIKAPIEGELVLPFKLGEIDKSGLSIVTSPKHSGDEISFDVTSYKAGDIQIPSFQIKIKDEILFETISLNIKVTGNTSQLQLVDIRPPKEISPSITYYISIIAIILVLVLIARSIYKKFFCKTKTDKKVEINTREIISAFDKAMRDLNYIQINQGNFSSVKDIIFKVTETLKRFIEEEHQIYVMDLTTTEVVETLSTDKRFDKTIVSNLSDFFKNSDFIKFANSNKETAVSIYIEKAKDFVNLMRHQ